MRTYDKNIQILLLKGEPGTTVFDELINKPTKLSYFENDGVFITKDANNLTNYYLKTETYTKNEVNNINCLANYYLKTDTYTKNEVNNINCLANYYLKTDIYTKNEVNNINILSNYYLKTETYTKSEVDNAISTALGAITNGDEVEY